MGHLEDDPKRVPSCHGSAHTSSVPFRDSDLGPLTKLTQLATVHLGSLFCPLTLSYPARLSLGPGSSFPFGGMRFS